MISIDDLVVRFDNRDGFDLVDYEIVGLPIWRLGLLLQTLEASPIAATEEFVLRLVDEGVDTVEGVSLLLGLEETIITKVAGDLVGMDAIAIQGGRMRLTRIGEDLKRTAVRTRPTEQSVHLFYDAIVRRPQMFQPYQLFEPREIRSEGVRGINPSPNRKPDASELDQHAVESYINDAVNGSDSTAVIRIKAVTSRRILYQKAVMLVFKAKHGDDVQVGFAIDRRLSDDHEFAFAKTNGPRRLGIDGGIRKKEEAPEALLLGGAKAGKLKTELYRNVSQTSSIRKELSEVRGRLAQVTGEEAASTVTGANDNVSVEVIKSLVAEKERLQRQLDNFSVHMVSVYEHPDYLRDAMESARTRILIISPWITRAVVDGRFLRALQARLRVGVEIFVGYGLDEREDESPRETSAERDLLNEAKRNPNLHMKRLGDTHAKVLIKDEEYIITTSFNWLSFRGNPNRRFREEWGTYIGVPETINAQFEIFRSRIIGGG